MKNGYVAGVENVDFYGGNPFMEFVLQPFEIKMFNNVCGEFLLDFKVIKVQFCFRQLIRMR